MQRANRSAFQAPVPIQSPPRRAEASTFMQFSEETRPEFLHRCVI